MKKTQVVVLMIAVVAGGLAGLVAMGGSGDSPQQVVVQAPQQETDEVLVAVGDIGIGQAIGLNDMEWRQWPKDGAAQFISRSAEPNALDELAAAVARTPFYAGEPIRRQKLIMADGSGFLSAILPPGMLAIAVETEASRGAGGFILPNDRVDIIVTESASLPEGEVYSSRTLIENVRVLAIDQTVEDTEEGQKVVVGETATLELTTAQSEAVASASEQGSIRLALRSLVDSNGPGGDRPRMATNKAGSTVRFGTARPVLRQE